jgi:hypothetical protein
LLLGENIAKYEDMHVDEFRLKLEIQDGHQEVVFGSFFNVNMTHLPLHHNSVVFKLSEHVVNMDGFF